MTCAETLPLLGAFADGELDLRTHSEVEAHLAACPACAAEARSLAELRTALAATPRFEASAALRNRVRQNLVPTTLAGRWRMPARVVAWVAPPLALLAAGFWLLSRGDDRLAERLVASHVRARQSERPFDVASSDRHVVKPWFQGKLDFAPPVPNLAEDGFVLAGARRDYLLDRPVAALVYRRRGHDAELFVWPASGDADQPTHFARRQGYRIAAWRRGGMAFAAISDLNQQEFDEFVNSAGERGRQP